MHPLALAVLAQQAGNPAAGYTNIFFLVAIVAVFYLMLIRPQQRRAKQHQQLVSSIGTGDRVVTIGGIHGTVDSIDEDTIRIEVAPGTVITMSRASIAKRLLDADTGNDGVTTNGETSDAS